MKNRKGISLIVLIITIIVVIILAGAVLLNLSDTNVIDNAEQAVLLSDVGNFKVELGLYQMEKYMNENGSYDPSKLNANGLSVTYNGNTLEGLTMYDIIPSMENKSNYLDFEIVNGELTYIGSDANIQNMLAGNSEEDSSSAIINPVVAIDTIVTENSTINGGEFSSDNPVIPVGFKAVNTDDASWDNNLSVSLNKFNTNKLNYKSNNYNVSLLNNSYKLIDNTFNILDSDKGLVIEDNVGNQFVWVPVDGVNVVYEKDFTYPALYSDTSSHTTDDILPTGIISEEYQINTYGGFYIARYEAGNESNVLVSKLGATVWNDISYTNSKIKSEGMYNNNYIKSGLVTGTMWDTMLDMIENSSKNVRNSQSGGNCSDSINPSNVSGYGSLQTTGYSEYWKSNNIYDLAGNVWEWTTDKYVGNFIVRGGSYNTNASSYPVSYRYITSTGSGYSNMGFRVALYII